uniref:MACPF domain-containing protein n=1 Tax=Riptortus pedestris TaxID=329032 RepID=R4WDW0_RIPPE|nr:conserved hypothetical protein [Riptortus pedestris]
MTLRKLYFGYGLLIVLLNIGVGVIVCENLRLGAAINLFERFGYLHISMRVVPRNESKWIFREPTVDIFKDIESMKNMKKSVDTNGFNGNFEIAFCDDLQELFKTYFQNFSIERLDAPWEPFLESFTNESLAYSLGINVSYVSGDHCYVLVRISRLSEKATFSPSFEPTNSSISESVLEKARTVKEGDVSSVMQFIKTFGSHYISSYSTGNSMYQVIVYSPKIYRKLKEKILSAGILEALGSSEINAMFSPQYAEHMGIVQTSSGNNTLIEWAQSTLQSSYTISSEDSANEINYTSLLKLYKNSKLLKELKMLLGNEALLHLNLKTVEPVFKDEKTRNWFVEILDNNLKLWEVN